MLPGLFTDLKINYKGFVQDIQLAKQFSKLLMFRMRQIGITRLSASRFSNLSAISNRYFALFPMLAGASAWQNGFNPF